MARRRPEVKEVSYGLYERFDADAKELPKLDRFATTVPLRVGQEFGYVLKIKHGRGLKIDFEIAHPRVPGPDGMARPPFTGEQYVRTSDFDFFLGDALWEPLEAMCGEWTLTTRLDGRQVAQRTFEVQDHRGVPDAETLPVQ